MKDNDKTQKQLIKELTQLRQRTTALEKVETERKQLEKSLHKVNRALRALSECNEILVQATDESALLHDICRIIVDAGYRLAWVGFAEHDKEKTVRPVAQTGYENGYLDVVNITWANTERGRGPTGKAIRTGKPAICKNILTDPNYTPWRTEAKKRGYASSIALPLIDDGQVFGTLNIYATEPDAFDAEEVKLLTELTNALAYGIKALRTSTARKKAEQELEESQERFKNAAQSASDLIWEWNILTGRLEWFGPIDKFLGYAPGKFPRTIQAWEKVIHSDDHDRVMAALDQHLKKQTPYDEEYRVRRKDGIYRSWIDRGTCLRDMEGNPLKMVGACTDITERKQTEEALHESARFLASIFKSIQDGISILDKAMNIVRVNPVLEQWYAHNMPLIGKKCYNAYHDRDKRCEVCPTWQTLRTGEPAYEVVPKRGPKGKIVGWLDLYSFPMIDAESGEMRGVIEYVRDITERKEVETALKESEQRFRTIFEGAIDGILLADIETKKFYTGNIIICKMLGYSLEEIKNLGVMDIHPKEALPFVMEQFDKLVRGEITKTSELPVQRKDGSVFYAEISSALLKLDAKTYLMGTFRDITDRKQAEAALQESEEKYRNLVERANDGIGIAQNSILHYVNPRLAQMIGYAVEELIGAPFSDFFIAEEVPKVVDHYKRRMAGKDVTPIYESALRHKDGSRIEVELNAGVISYKGKPADLVMVRDIAERKKVEKERRESEERFRLAFENANTGVCLVDLEGNLTRVNSKMCEIFGYTKEELERMTVNDIAHPEDIDKSPEFIQKTLQGEIDRGTFQKRYFHKKGHVVTCEVSSSLVRNAEGAPLYFISHVHDITDRKQTEEALRDSEEKYRDLVENINDILYAADKHGIITYIAPTIEPLSGYAPSDIIGRPFFDFVYEEDLSYMRDKFQQDLSGQAEPHEYRMVTQPGDVRWVRTSSRPFFQETRVMGLRGVLTDITVRKQAEEEVKRGYEQLQETLHSTVSALASTVEMKDQYTAGHQPRVTQLACAIAEEMGLPAEQIEGIRMAASIHDIGKIMVPAEILNKPGPLTEIQYEMIKMHPRAGYDILKGLKLPWPVAQIILQHHELMDGSGYPQGLSGEKIMVEARILTVANVVEAMNAHRPYRPAYDIKEALAEISKNKGILYDSAAVEACLRLFMEKGFTLNPVPR